MSKMELLAALEKSGIELNDSAKALFAMDNFTTSAVSSVLQTVEISVDDLGCAEGAVTAEIDERAVRLGLALCPLELGPHLRLQLLDQPEGSRGFAPSAHRAPPGSITVASNPLSDDDRIPKGFYLRRIEGVLWLRGYHCGPEHVWSPEDHFVFCSPLDTH
jgi:hypothetical protein